MKTILLTFLAVTAIVALSGCNTVRGVGEDVTVAGRGIQRAGSTR